MLVVKEDAEVDVEVDEVVVDVEVDEVVDDDDELEEDDDEDDDEEEDDEDCPMAELPLPAGNMTRVALDPLGMVTTQKLALPAPESSLDDPFTWLMSSVAGSMEQGNPLQPPSGHSILTP